MLVEFFVGWIVAFIAVSSYFGVFFLMALESMVFPVPSEAVMPFAGFLVEQGEMDFWLVALAATIGSIVGSMASYWIGEHFGEKFVKRFGKYFLLNEHHLKLSENFFRKYGPVAIFVCRFVPAVRHVISIPAGAAKMNKASFLLLTFFGALCWNSILLYVGVVLKQNWQELLKYSSFLDIIVIVVVVCFALWFLLKKK